jgi:hypothetical protein
MLDGQPRLFRYAKHKVQTLNRHARGAFAEIVEPGREENMA